MDGKTEFRDSERGCLFSVLALLGVVWCFQINPFLGIVALVAFLLF